MATPTLGGGNLTSADVLAFAQRLAETDQGGYTNLCQKFVREAFGSAGGAKTAVEAWRNTPVKHTQGTPPPGTAVYWGGGAGHAAISAGNGFVYTTDWGDRLGKISLVPIDAITQKWGKPLLGWTTQTNERKITRLNATPVEGKGAGGVNYDYRATGTTAGGDQNTTYSRKELRERYGYAAAFYDQVPAVKKLLGDAVKGQWTPEEFAARVRATAWYRKHTEEERQWVMKSTESPAEAQQQIRQKKLDLQNLYRRLGVPVAPDRLTEIATASLKHGWSEQQERNALVAEFDYNPDKTLGGAAGQTVDQFRQMAANYVVPLSNSTLDKWTQSVLRGEGSADDFLSYIKTQAKSQWDDPGLQAAIDRGVTVNDYLSPYKETAANTLGLNPDQVDWQDPKWQQAVFHRDDKGARGLMSLADFNRLIRTDDRFGFDRSQNGVGQGTQLAQRLADLMGG